jgi:cold shock protein
MLDFPTRTPYTGPSFRRRAPDRQLPMASYVRSSGGPEAPGMGSGLRASEDTAMPTGTIARLLIDKGFGFIRDEGGIEHFFHRSSVRQAVFELLREGQRVEFQAEESAKGPRAGDVRLIEG